MDNTTNLDVQAFWERLKQIYKTRNLSQKAVCEELGFNAQSFINKKNLGYFPTVEQLVKISQHFGISLNYLITGNIDDESDNELQVQFNELQKQLDTYKQKFEKIKEIINDSSSLPSSE